MVGLLLVLSVLSVDVQWEVSETGIFRPLELDEIAVTKTGEILIVHRRDAKVLKYDAGGNFIKAIGQRGQGPGEFALPTWIHYQNGKFYVEDANQNRISVFDESGSFVETIILPESNYQIKKVQGGWIYGDWETSDDNKRPVKLVLVDEHFKNPRQIATWPRPAENSSQSVQSQGGEIPKVPINPAVDEANLCVSPDGRFAYFTRDGKADLEIVDIAKAKIVKVQASESRPAPFNEDWGQTQLDALIERVTGGAEGFPIKFVANFPSHFPLVRHLEAKPNGDVTVIFWTGIPEKRHKLEIYGADHERKESDFSPVTLSRWLAQRGDWSYVTYFDANEEEGRIACVKTKDLNSFVANHPIHFEGLSGKAIVNID